MTIFYLKELKLARGLFEMFQGVSRALIWTFIHRSIVLEEQYRSAFLEIFLTLAILSETELFFAIANKIMYNFLTHRAPSHTLLPHSIS